MEITRAVKDELIDATVDQLDDPSKLTPDARAVIESMSEDRRDELRNSKVRLAELEALSTEIMARPAGSDSESAEETFRKRDEARRDGKKREHQIPRDIDEDEYRHELSMIQDETEDAVEATLLNGNSQVALDTIEMEEDSLIDRQTKIIRETIRAQTGRR